MKMFEGHLTHKEVVKACTDAGFFVDTQKYDGGGDWITIDGAFAGQNLSFIYSSWNGKFIGRTPTGGTFSESDEKLEGTDWYDAILDFLYVTKADDSAAA